MCFLSPADCECNLAGTVSSVAECAQVSKLISSNLSFNTVVSSSRGEYALMQLVDEYLPSSTEKFKHFIVDMVYGI